MPVDKARYPANWSEISQRIRERDGQRCKFCGAPNHIFIQRRRADRSIWIDCEGDEKEDTYWTKAVLVVLTVAHLNHDTRDNSDSNLAALCQRCHNVHDVPYRRQNAKVTRGRKKRERAQASGQLELMGEV